MHACMHTYINTYIYKKYVNQIKTANNVVGDLGFLFLGKSSDVVEWSCFF